MHNNYYFLRQLSLQLETKLRNTVISECFSQSKDELIIRFETHTVPFFIKASLLPGFSCLSFPRDFQRARKNSINLFDAVIGCRLISVRQFKNERSFALQFENSMSLLFKMHGNRSNIILFQNEEVAGVFKNSIHTDTTLILNTLDRSIDWSYENFIRNQDTLISTYFTFGKVVWHYLKENGFESKAVDEKWAAIQHMLKMLENPVYFIADTNTGLILTLLPYQNILTEHRDAVEAVTDFYYTSIQSSAFIKEKLTALSSLKATLQQYENYRKKTLDKLLEVESDNQYKMWADLIMANLYAIQPRSERITLPNFYANNQPTDIKLKEDLSPQKNAEVFYRKSRNQHIERERLQQALQGKEKEITSIRKKIEDVETVVDLKTLRNILSILELNPKKEKQPEPLPYHAFEYNGYKIWVGRNAQSNDKLTLKYSFKEDLWLHAKDVAGSHVILKYQSGKNFPKDVIERAAQLAAYHSKRKHESLCPVVVTPKKFVRKRKGDPAGAVIVEREEVIMVEPQK